MPPVNRSLSELTPFCSSVSAPKATIEIGVSWRFSSRFCAVTTISAIPPSTPAVPDVAVSCPSAAELAVAGVYLQAGDAVGFKHIYRQLIAHVEICAVAQPCRLLRLAVFILGPALVQLTAYDAPPVFLFVHKYILHTSFF